MFTYNFEGNEIQVHITKHAKERLESRDILSATLYSTVVDVSDHLLDLKSGDEFVLIAKDIGVAIVGNITCVKLDTIVTVFTVINSSHICIQNKLSALLK